MTKVVKLQTYREKALKQRCFGPWEKRFGESYDIATGLRDLSDKTIYYLSLPGDHSTHAFYELIMGVLDLDQTAGFHYLENADQLNVVDIHLFVADQVRFELMRRLGWVTSYSADKNTLLEMVQKCAELRATAREIPPALAESHPEYIDYQELTRGDKEVFIRRLLQEALEVFKERLED
jgi:hypothetical protein